MNGYYNDPGFMAAGRTELDVHIGIEDGKTTLTLDTATALHVRDAIQAAAIELDCKARRNKDNPMGSWYSAAAERLRAVETAADIAAGGPFPTYNED